MTAKIRKSDAEWRRQLSREQYAILRQQATERPFSGKYVHEKSPGIYACAACGQALFSSTTKYDSHCGWPSFWDVVDGDHVELREDRSYGMRRIEVLCRRCDSHLGHVFEDGPRETTGLRYCINSLALDLQAETPTPNPFPIQREGL
ncbi:MAG: peptide-methionine (R)-S-oxide reductase MsrB [Chloroflexi bacterium]|nr:peptide-methionine (R)-S-oxide reductase MsrB [Chloroflexota bacterium]MCY3582646.1 peptide-methionine (R)-S-oxide reductase MsrB [Chloroflexota bacterium]MCY3716599.1 peptide-methionine (R)-S-oxide reductase MsrB [Chloroflexota bacterium]MDE2652128.1 peptide-methionine (R)-S-oxide reductase MsrB [Chloroflexota bacterium]MYC54679.1 peptide-methionine (R)-S-oxide reductase MsrB [Chloroflexota bacterium]